MPDEATQAPAEEVEAQDTPTQDTEPEAPETKDTPEATDTQEAVDYEKRYSDLRSEFDRRNQALSGQLGPEAQAEAIRQYGLELEQEQDDSEDDDTYVDPDERIDRLEKQLAARSEQEQQQAELEQEADYIDSELQGIAKAEGRDLDEKEVELLVSYSLANREENGAPNVKAAHEALKALYADARKRLVAAKKAPKAPTGAAGEETMDTSTLAGRRAAIQAIAEESASD